MPKVPATSPRLRNERRHNPLSEDIVATGLLRNKSGKKKSKETTRRDEESYVNSKASRKILSISRHLAEEEEELNKAEHPLPNPAFDFESRFENEPESEDENGQYSDEDAWKDDESVEEVECANPKELDPNDLETFQRFMPSNDDPLLTQTFGPEEGEGTNLANLILQKIAAHEANQASSPQRPIVGGGNPENAIELPAKVVEVYTKIGLLLSRYKSGKLPKPFKILPTLPHWETLLSITRPEEYTPNACYEAAKIFISANPLTAQRFLSLVLLDRVRDEIHETKKLNVHLYKALKKALYRPAAFFKGFLFPLVESTTCTLREAAIVSSILARVSIPVLHSAAALMRLCETAAEQSAGNMSEGGGAVNVFIRVLLEKKYALPYKVVDALVFHFLRFKGEDNCAENTGAGKLPVLWHQCLLAFAQRYRNDITEDQREALLDLLLVKGHAAIGPEVRRELLEGRGRGVLVAEEMEIDSYDDTMVIDNAVVIDAPI
ncbi:MAG: hypothetical protein M1829_006902 [Trizodia sp. TS-e1964]|nr:MAG: hypothetical protein M1829_006902 [Trizodia sp. TS-e1964]